MILQVDDIHTYYGESLALQGLSFGIRQGETVCLLCLLYTSPSPRD